MSLRLLVVAAVLVSVTGIAEAGIFGSQDKLPKAISLITERVERNPFVGFQARHPPKQYSAQQWGARWDLSFKTVIRPLGPSLHDR